MKTLNVIYHLALADFYERTRRFQFLLILAGVVFLGAMINNGTFTLSVVGSDLTTAYRGVLNSAWIGTMTVLVINSLLFLLGFYLVSGCIQRDTVTGVGQIIATTPISRAAYLVGKWISNCLVLSVMWLILAAAAVIMVLLQDQAALDLGPLLLPFLAVALPSMALTAALAVVVETIPWLRGMVGNVVYFFGWIGLLLISLLGIVEIPFPLDPLGVNIFRPSLYAGAGAAYPNETFIMLSAMGNTPGSIQTRIFDWSGVAWTPGTIAGQWLWVVISIGLLLLSAAWFARFDPSRERLMLVHNKSESPGEDKSVKALKKVLRILLPDLSPLISNLAQRNPFLGVLFAELRLLLKGHPLWWWSVTVGLNFSILTNPPETVDKFLLPFVWLWPVSVWAGMGNREVANNTFQMVFSAARPVLRQLPAAWLAGVLTSVLLTTSAAVFQLVHDGLPGLAGWAGAVLFIPALALALGVLSSGRRLFEVGYLFWWYIGPLQHTPGLDFTAGAPQVFLLAAAGLLVISALWRGRQVRA